MAPTYGNLTDVKTSTSGGVTGHTQYVYDDANRLTDVITHDPATDANVHKSTFAINGFSRVALATEFSWNGSQWVQASQKHYVYDGMDPYVELGDSTGDIKKILLRGGNGEILSEPIESNPLAPPHMRYYYQDGSGSVSDVVDYNVGTYTLLGHYDYDAHGNLTGTFGSDPNANYYRYSGKEYIPSVGMYNYGYRFYSPGTGRFINRDPISEAGGLNVYAFVGNNPVNNIDEYGLYSPPVGLSDGNGNAYFGNGGRRKCLDYNNSGNSNGNGRIPIAVLGKGLSPGKNLTPELKKLLDHVRPYIKRPNEPNDLNRAFGNGRGHETFGYGSNDFTSIPQEVLDDYKKMAQHNVANGNDPQGEQARRLRMLEEWENRNRIPNIPPFPSLDPVPLFYYDPGMYNFKTKRFEHPRMY